MVNLRYQNCITEFQNESHNIPDLKSIFTLRSYPVYAETWTIDCLETILTLGYCDGLATFGTVTGSADTKSWQSAETCHKYWMSDGLSLLITVSMTLQDCNQTGRTGFDGFWSFHGSNNSNLLPLFDQAWSVRLFGMTPRSNSNH